MWVQATLALWLCHRPGEHTQTRGDSDVFLGTELEPPCRNCKRPLRMLCGLAGSILLLPLLMERDKRGHPSRPSSTCWDQKRVGTAAPGLQSWGGAGGGPC